MHLTLAPYCKIGRQLRKAFTNIPCVRSCPQGLNSMKRKGQRVNGEIVRMVIKGVVIGILFWCWFNLVVSVTIEITGIEKYDLPVAEYNGR